MPLFPGDEHGGRLKAEQNPPAEIPSLAKSDEQRKLDRKRRQRELFIAAGVFAVLLVFILVQLQGFDGASIPFFVFFNFTAIVFIGILFVVLRNGIKLLLERKQRVMGSRLRTRLVLAISAMTLVPCLVMFLVTAQFVKISLDFWFKDQVESTIENALDVTGASYENMGRRMKAQASFLLREIQARGYPWGSGSLQDFLGRKRVEYVMALAGILGPDKAEVNWQTVSVIGSAWEDAKKGLDWERLELEGFLLATQAASPHDLMFCLIAIQGGPGGYLVLGEAMGMGIESKRERIAAGASDYRTLRSFKQPLKATLYVTLSILTALIALTTIWFAFKVGKELTDPITALVSGTERLAEGDTDVHIEDDSSDEFGVLVSAFNRMAGEIGQSRLELTSTNDLLAQQNMVLDQQRQYVETVLDNIATGVISVDTSWRIATINKAACNLLERTQEEVLGHSVMEFIGKSQSGKAQEMGERLYKRPGSHLQNQFTFIKDDEDRHLLVTAVGLSSSGRAPQGAVIVFEDVTEMEKAQRMAAWREVARRIAHEIKNPLTPIKLSAQRLEKKFSKDIADPVFKQSTRLIVHQVEQLQGMVQEFFSFAKFPEIRLRQGNITPLLEEVVTMFRNSHSRVAWNLNIKAPLPELELDESAMQRVFINILTNAVEAVAEKSGAQNGDGEPPAVYVNAWAIPDKKLLRIDFEDNGPGLQSDEERSRLFEPYFSRKKGGTGLGLTIVRSAVTEHHGYVRAFRREGGGTVISVELPVFC